MAVTSCIRTLRPGVDHNLALTIAVAQHIQPALLERDRIFLWESRGQTFKFVESRLAKEPERFLARPMGENLKVPAAEQNGPGGERIEQMRRLIPRGVKQPSAVIVAESRHRSDSGQGREYLQHPQDCAIKFARNRNLIQGCQHRGVQEKVQSVDVIVSRLLKVQAITAHLAFRLGLDNLPSSPLPRPGRRNLRTQCADEKQRYGFSQQMSVGREVS